MAWRPVLLIALTGQTQAKLLLVAERFGMMVFRKKTAGMLWQSMGGLAQAGFRERGEKRRLRG